MTKNSNIKRGFFSIIVKIILVIYFIFIGIALLSVEIPKLFIDDTEEVPLADGFTIEEYNVILDVKEDNKIDVREKITVNFTDNYKHGIYKITPEWLQYTGKDGKIIKRRSQVLDYQAIGNEYYIDTINKKQRIRIGSANEYVGIGEKNYVIKYTYDMGKDPFKDFDELIYHAYGDYWGTEIKNASLQINMPKSIEGYNINFFTDKYRKNNANDIVDYKIDGNSLYATFNAQKNYQKQLNEYCKTYYQDKTCDTSSFVDYIPLKRSLTVDIELPEGYFKGGSWNYGWGSFLITLIIFIITGWTIYKWFKYGKDHDKKAETVEFYPPDNLNAAEIGYIYNNNQTNKKLTIALIIQLASKGYIKIDELNDKEKNIQITNLAIKPHEVEDFNNKPANRVIEVKKLKDMDDNLSQSETTMMIHLFKSGDTKLLDTNIDTFIAVKDKLINNGYIEILSDNEELRQKEIKTKYEEHQKKLAQYDIDMKTYNQIISKLPPISNLEKIVYDRLFEFTNTIILSEHPTFYRTFNDVESGLKDNFKDKIHDKIATNQIGGSILRNIAILILCIVSYRYVEDLDPNWKILYTLSFLCNFINLIFVPLMKRKTEYGELITAKVKGFRNFLLTVEKEKLESLVAENPGYFYDILPFTYVMNISRKWVKKFENIKMPEMNMGTFNYSSDLSFHSLYDNIYYPEPIITFARGSSGSSGKGGCSSCGGGCSSCGGGGSW